MPEKSKPFLSYTRPYTAVNTAAQLLGDGFLKAGEAIVGGNTAFSAAYKGNSLQTVVNEKLTDICNTLLHIYVDLVNVGSILIRGNHNNGSAQTLHNRLHSGNNAVVVREDDHSAVVIYEIIGCHRRIRGGKGVQAQRITQGVEMDTQMLKKVCKIGSGN